MPLHLDLSNTGHPVVPQALKMLADYQQTVRRPNAQPSLTSTKSQVLSHRISAMKPSNQAQSNSRRPVEALAIPSIGPFVSGSDGNLQEVWAEAITLPNLFSHMHVMFCHPLALEDTAIYILNESNADLCV